VYFAWQSTQEALPVNVAPGISGGGATARLTVEQEIRSTDAPNIHAPSAAHAMRRRQRMMNASAAAHFPDVNTAPL